MDKWRKEVSVFLKIKLKSLAAEARIIRRQERKTGGKHDHIRESLYLHRLHVVRRASRETHLAYGYLRGRPYRAMERNALRGPDWKSVASMVKKYGEFKEEDFKSWQEKE